jgi:CPA1 family monovalent cation:H+ antiporter
MTSETVTVLLFAVATAVALLARSLKVPYTVALVVAGISLGATRALPAPHLTKELLYAVFLPGLVFDAAFHLPYEGFRRNKLAITLLAFPGVLAAVLISAWLLSAWGIVGGGRWQVALVFAALIAATNT